MALPRIARALAKAPAKPPSSSSWEPRGLSVGLACMRGLYMVVMGCREMREDEGGGVRWCGWWGGCEVKAWWERCIGGERLGVVRG